MPTGLEIFTQPAVIKPTIGSVFNNLNAQAKQQKRLYIGNVPAQVQDDELIDFFNRAMVNGRKTTQPGNPIIACQMNRDKAYAFLEFRTAEEASAGKILYTKITNLFVCAKFSIFFFEALSFYGNWKGR